MWADENEAATTFLTEEQWVHLVIVKNGSELYAYKNGLEVILLENITTSHARTLLLGNSLFNGKYFHGKIDDVRIYNRTLSDEEIDFLYHELD